MEKAIGQKGELVASLFAIWCCYCTLLLHPYSQCIRLSEKRFYSVIQSYFIITDFLQNCQKSILLYQVPISLKLYMSTTPSQKVHAESQYCPLPLRLFTGNTKHIYLGNVILCAHPSWLTYLIVAWSTEMILSIDSLHTYHCLVRLLISWWKL